MSLKQKEFFDTDSIYLAPQLRPEPCEYLDPSQSWGSFALLKKSKNYLYAQQKCYPLSELHKVIEICTNNSLDYWITQGTFNKFNRRKVNLHSIGVCFVDLDYYNILRYAEMEPEQLLQEHLFPFFEAKHIPFPSLIIDSGAGLQIKWFTERLPARALPRWDCLQNQLTTLLEGFGGDKRAKDASRVLRLVGTINQKTKRPVKVVWVDTDKNCLPIRYEFGLLCDNVLPYTQEQIADFKKKNANKKKSKGTKFNVSKSSPADVISMLKSPNALTLENLNWNRMHDLKKIVEMRGGMGDGFREPMAFYLCNFYALRYAQSGLSDSQVWHEFYQLCRIAAPSWDHSKATNKVSNVFKLMKETQEGKISIYKGREVPLLYIPSNDTIINTFNITSDEQKELITIIDSKEKLKRKAEANKKIRKKPSREEYLNKVYNDSNNRIKEVLRLESCGFKQAEIADFLKISVNAVKSLKKRLKTSF